MSMKKTLLILFLCATLFISACASPPAPPPPSQDVPATARPPAPIPQSPPSTGNSTNLTIDYPLERHIVSWAGRDGHTADAEIRIGSWIRGSDMEFLQEAWNSAGGSGNVPLPQGAQTGTDTNVYLVGIANVENTTQGFELDRVHFYINPVNPGRHINMFPPIFSVQFGDNLGSLHDNTTGRVALGFFAESVPPGYTWGAVPFVVSLIDILSPAYPNGPADFVEQEYVFRFGQMGGGNRADSESFRIGFTW